MELPDVLNPASARYLETLATLRHRAGQIAQALRGNQVHASRNILLDTLEDPKCGEHLGTAIALSWVCRQLAWARRSTEIPVAGQTLVDAPVNLPPTGGLDQAESELLVAVANWTNQRPEAGLEAFLASLRAQPAAWQHAALEVMGTLNLLAAYAPNSIFTVAFPPAGDEDDFNRFRAHAFGLYAVARPRAVPQDIDQVTTLPNRLPGRPPAPREAAE